MNAFCVLLLLVAPYHSAFAVWPQTPFEAVNYLLRYGYLNPDYSMRTNPSKFLLYAVKNFQKKSMLNVTGKIDEFTLHQMQKKRCGVPDFSREALKKIFQGPDIRISLSKRDATQAHWDKTDLTYHIKNYTLDLSKKETDETIRKALQVWADVSKLTFKQVNDDSAEIIIDFTTGEHGDGVPFDGPGGTLAHAYFPETNMNPIEGDAHFDEDEMWILENSQNGTNLFCTAVHEFGHSLGLSHTYNSGDIMFPFETDCAEFRLSENDIATIQELYGKPDNSTTTTKPVPVTTINTKRTTLGETTPSTTSRTTLGETKPSTTSQTTLGETTPSTTSRTTLGETTPSTTSQTTLGETTPSTTSQTTLGETTPSTTSQTTLGETTPSTTSRTTLGETTPSTTSRTTLGETKPSTTSQTTPSLKGSSTTEKPTTPSFSFTNVTTPSTTLPAGTTNQRELTTHKSILPFPELCEGFLDAITFGADGNLYVFFEFLVFMFDYNGVVQDYYTLISDVFPRAPSTVDSAFTVNQDDYDTSFTYLIKDHMVWKYYFRWDHEQFQLAVGYPRHRQEDFPHAPSSIGAAFYTDGKTYLIDFLGDSYMEYRYDCELSTFESLTHTKSIRASEYFRKFPRDASVDDVCVSGDGNLNVFVQDDWYIVDPTGDITEAFKTYSFFGCNVTIVSDRRKHSPHRRKHSPHRRKHSPHRRKYSPHKQKHSHKKHKKSPKRDKHRKRDRYQRGHRRH